MAQRQIRQGSQRHQACHHPKYNADDTRLHKWRQKLYLTGVAPCTAQTTPQTFQSSHEIFVDLERQQIGENGALKVLRVSEFQG